ncbi:nitrite reductase [Actinotalea ferrariae CF5-4]|uniref:Copper-containing nitrite reductase n=1 Tax=Actinotalea ferrariae CF5-4 TaxID=948458 RepID=A0A021VVW8_9CELL|nr:multicopper oxidase domain-containing protein [Actinotalea ferrariae]EYR65268.1 nitrite reductase [Actinotalea ferrariae CF5-4]
MTTTHDRTTDDHAVSRLPEGPPSGSSGDRAGLLGGLALGAVMLVIALVVALSGASAPTGGSVAVPGGGDGPRTVQVTLSGMRITPAVIEVPSGTHLVLEVTNDDAMRHDLVLASGEQTPVLGGGESSTLDLGVVDAGVDGWCSLPGHKAAGMTMTIIASDADGEAVESRASHTSSGTATGVGATSERAALDLHAAPGPDWQPYDPHLQPLPGGTEHIVRMAVTDTVVEVAPGVRQTLWTFNGTAPGPTLHGQVGDLFTITFVNEATTGHGIDFHAGALAPDQPMRTIDPGEELTYQFVAQGSGAWLYHCSTKPMSLHIANGMYGAVIIEPPSLEPVDTELVMVQSELYLGPDGGTADEAAIAAEAPSAVVFNGYVNQYAHAPVAVRAGERIRVWVVAAGPQRGTAFHVVGAQFDTVFKEGAYLLRPGNAERGLAQVLDLAPGQGGFVELVLPEPGRYPFTDHAMVDGERGAHGVLEAS